MQENAEMKKKKAAEPDQIVIETLTALDNFGIDKVTEVKKYVIVAKYQKIK